MDPITQLYLFTLIFADQFNVRFQSDSCRPFSSLYPSLTLRFSPVTTSHLALTATATRTRNMLQSANSRWRPSWWRSDRWGRSTRMLSRAPSWYPPNCRKRRSNFTAKIPLSKHTLCLSSNVNQLRYKRTYI